jgi:hypothetical protein
MAADQSTPGASLKNKRPIEFRSLSEEVAVGAVMGCLIGSVGTMILSGLVGAVGAGIGSRFGRPMLVGSIVVWLAFWVLPLMFLMSLRPWWRFVAVISAGAAYLALFQWHIHQRDIGTFYPWVLTAVPFGIVLGTFFEPIRLAHGGSTEDYVQRGITVTEGMIAYGNGRAFILACGCILGLVADVFSFGRPRIGAMLGGLLGGGLFALASSSMVASRGDTSVASLFLGSNWNIAWAGTALGAVTGAVSGWWAALIRETQQRRLQLLLENDEPLLQRKSSDNIKEAT